LDRYQRTPVACDRVCGSERYEFSSRYPFQRPRGIVPKAGLVDAQQISSVIPSRIDAERELRDQRKYR
jgi:hypothetical protein